jgi:polyhydroxybutyrate depolymerase
MMLHLIFRVVLVWLVAVPVWASEQHAIQVGGLDRSYLLYRPASLERAQAVPLVIVLHGGFGSGAQAEKAYNWDAKADEQGFVVVYPDGKDRTWNAGGGCCGPAYKQHLDDTGFLTALIHAVQQSERIDMRRVYITGISNGAAMSYRYACDGQIPVAAVGSVAGNLMGACDQLKPTSLVEIHGLQDHNIPFAGGPGSKGYTHLSWNPVQQGVDKFIQADQCGAPTVQQAGVVNTISANCKHDKQVVLITIADAGHQWPGAVEKNKMLMRMLNLDSPSQAMDATSVLWDFFKNKYSTAGGD